MFFAAFQNYFDFTGRATRREFWSFILVYLVGLILGYALVFGSIDFNASKDEILAALGESTGFLLGLIVLIFWGLITLIPSISVTVRRLHDQNMSGWWYLGFIGMGLLPFLNILSGIVWLILMLMPGTPTGNRYGENPRDSGWKGGDAHYA